MQTGTIFKLRVGVLTPLGALAPSARSGQYGEGKCLPECRRTKHQK